LSCAAGRAGAVTLNALVYQLRALGVGRGGVLLVHTSFRALQPVAGGPAGLIDALQAALGPDGTLVMPSWPDDATAPFDPTTSDAAPDLGVVARTFWRQAGVRRSGHVQAFAAIGPQADAILRDPLPLPPHILASPVGRVYEQDGHVLLLGVGHEANTTLHLAEVLAGVPYGITHRCGATVDGRHTVVEYRENDHCCARFALADAWLREAGRQAEGPVGHGQARLMRARDVVDAALARLSPDPLLFLHDAGVGCDACDAARASIA
jgi:aminoglycoside N3'-acetyltransferase